MRGHRNIPNEPSSVPEGSKSLTKGLGTQGTYISSDSPRSSNIFEAEQPKPFRRYNLGAKFWEFPVDIFSFSGQFLLSQTKV